MRVDAQDDENPMSSRQHDCSKGIAVSGPNIVGDVALPLSPGRNRHDQWAWSNTRSGFDWMDRHGPFQVFE
jgi:hypothetical protein